jgi:hypothetical protein
MKPGELYTNKEGDVLLYKEWIIDDYHKRSRLYLFKVIHSKTIKSDTIEFSYNYLNYLKILPRNNPAWILYGKV